MRRKGSSLFRLGLKRRKHEVRRLRVMMCLAVFFLAFPFLFQDNMNGYQMNENYRTFGRWIVCSESTAFDADPKLEESGYIRRGSKINTLWPLGSGSSLNMGLRDQDVWQITDENRGELRETWNTSRNDNSHFTGSYVGALSPGMAERNGIEILEGRFPENDGEIAMEASVLDTLGQGREIGSDIYFYISRFDDVEMLKRLLKDYIGAIQEKLDGVSREEGINADVVYDYDVGSLAGRNELYLVKYTLVGTIERYSSRWNSEMSGNTSGDLPGAFLTQNEFERLEMSKRVFHYYDVKPEYRTQDFWNTANELMDGIQTSEAYALKSFSLNRNAYDNPLWGNADMYRSITILLIVISTCVIAYLMANYLGKRRRFFIRMREIGASTADVWKMAVYECLGSVLPAAAVTLAVSYLLSVAAVLIASSVLGIRFFYVFSFKTMGMILGAAALTLGLSMGSALLLFSGRSLAEKKTTLSPHAVRRIKKRASRKLGRRGTARADAEPDTETDTSPTVRACARQTVPKRYLGLLETLRRDRISHRLKNRLLNAVSVLLCAIVIFCLAKTWRPASEYFRFVNSVRDFYGETVKGIRNVKVNVTVPKFWDGHGWHSYLPVEWSREGYASSYTIPRVAVTSIDTMSGVNGIDWRCSDYTHRITFEGKDGDPYFQTYLNTFLVNNQPYNGEYELDLTHEYAHFFVDAVERDFYGICCKRNAEEYWKRYERFLDPAVADYDAFVRGEQVIAVVDTQMRRALQLRTDYGAEPGGDLLIPETGPDGGAWYGYQPSFAPGDELTVCCRNDYELRVTVAGVVPLSESGLGYEDERFLTLFGSDGFMQRVCDGDSYDEGMYFSIPWSYNYFEADIHAISAKERSVIDLVNLCAKYNIRYVNNVSERIGKRTEMIRSAVTYGIFGLMLAVLFFFVLSCIEQDEEARRREQYRILSRFGMTESRMRREKRLDAVRRILPLAFALPVYLLIRLLSDYLQNREQIPSAADHGAMHGAPRLTETLRRLWSGANPVLACIVIGVFAIICWFILSRMDREWRKTT